MELYEAIKSRYSARKYEDKPVEDEKLIRVLDAGRLAPSGNNTQPWKFIVVRDGELRAGLAEASEQPWIKNAPVIIAVVMTDPERVMLCDVQAGPVNCSIAIDHMSLAAVAEGLGSCWIGHFDQDTARTLLAVPDSLKIVELLTLGYPKDCLGSKKRKPLDEIVCYERYQ